MTICVITDVSGSMAEVAKKYIATMLLRCIADGPETERSFRYFQWGRKLNETSFDAPIEPSGQAELSALATLCKTETAVLLLSDGFFSSDEIAVFSAEQKQCALNVVAVGGDADIYKLEKLAGRGNVYAPEDIFAALEAFDAGIVA
jgi:hypothetical protein